jgi:hypothetical protein
MDDLEDLDRTLRDRLDAIGPEARAILLHVLKLPDLERVRSIEEFHGDPRTRRSRSSWSTSRNQLTLVPSCWESFGSGSYTGETRSP